MNSDVLAEAKRLAMEEIERYGLPTQLHFELSLAKGQEIARALGAEASVVAIGTCLMDVKLGQAFAEGRLGDHVEMSREVAEAFVKRFSLEEHEVRSIINSVVAHHGSVPFESLEAEVVANADCYRFLHPVGVVHYIGTLSKRGLSLEKVVDGAEAKLDEKWEILTLEGCRRDLEPYYKTFKETFSSVRQGLDSLGLE